MSTAKGPGPVPGVFTRNATGLVREASGIDAAIYNMIWSSVPLASVFIFGLGVSAYLGANLYWTVLLNAIICLPTAFLYAVMSNAMPRSGADYVWVSRSLHPVLGFMSNFNFVIWMLYFIGVYSTLLADYGISTVLRVLAAFLKSPGIVGAAGWFVTPVGVFTIGIILVLLSGTLFIFGKGLKTFMKIQRWGFLLYLVGAVLLPIIVVFVSSRAFPGAFNHYMAGLHVQNAYNRVMQAGAFTPATHTNWLETALAMTLPFYIFGNIFQSAYFAGEIKRGRGTHAWSMPGTLVITTVLVLLLVWAFHVGVGTSFLGAISAADPSKIGLGFTPIYAELAAAASGNVVIGFIITLGFAVGLMFWVPQTIVLISRSLFAWSFDGLVSSKVSEVNPRTHSPTFAMVIIVIFSCISVALVSFIPGLTALVGLLGLTLTLLSVSVAGILFPFKQRETWNGSAYNGTTFGLPSVTWLGILSTIAMIIMAIVLLADPNSGTGWSDSKGMVYTVIIIYLCGLPFYLIARGLQRAKGIDVSLAYKEIPPE